MAQEGTRHHDEKEYGRTRPPKPMVARSVTTACATAATSSRTLSEPFDYRRELLNRTSRREAVAIKAPSATRAHTISHVGLCAAVRCSSA